MTLQCCNEVFVVVQSPVTKFCLTFKPHGLQHARLPCPSLSPGVCLNSCPSNWWCLPTITSSVPFSFCLHSFPASGSFPMSWFFASGGPSIGASASALVLPMNIHSGLISFRIDWSDLFAGQGTLKSLFRTTHGDSLNVNYGLYLITRCWHWFIDCKTYTTLMQDLNNMGHHIRGQHGYGDALLNLSVNPNCSKTCLLRKQVKILN